MEFKYLSDITGNKIYAEKIEKIVKKLANSHTRHTKGTSFPLFWDVESGRPLNSYTSLGAMGDSFFEYLIKEWIRSGHKDWQAKDMFYKASAGKMGIP